MGKKAVSRKNGVSVDLDMSSASSSVGDNIVIPELEACTRPNYRKFWSEKEDSILRTYYSRVQTIKIAKYLNRSYAAITTRVRKLGLKWNGR